MQEASMRLSGQTQNARRRKMRNCLTHTHHEMSERKHNMMTWHMTNYTFVVSFFIIIIIFFILLSPPWNSMHWLGDPKKKVVANGEIRCASWKDYNPDCLHICVFLKAPFLQVPPTSRHTTTTIPHLELNAAQGPDQNHSHMPECCHTLPLHSLSPEPLSFLIGQSWWHHPMVWHICTKWLVFVYLSKYQGALLWEKW